MGIQIQVDNSIEPTEPNIIFFNSFCNLNCTYCYEELNTVESKHLTKLEIVKAINEVVKTEDKEKQSVFVLFGGEPTLSWYNVRYFMDYAYNQKKNVHFNMVTNGVKFYDDEFYDEYFKNEHVKAGRLSLDISFDGKGNDERVFHDGKKSTITMLHVLSKLKFNSIQYRIRYTINTLNYSIFEDDIQDIIRRFEPSRIILNTTNDFTENQFKAIARKKQELIDRWNYQVIKIPICELVCSTCNGCSIGGTANLFAPEKEKEKASDKFESFNKKGK